MAEQPRRAADPILAAYRKNLAIAEALGVRDIEVEVKPPGGSPSSPQTGR